MTLGGVILAGGRSSRMGTDKALIDWRGVPLVVHVYEAVKAATDGPVVVVGAPGQTLPVPTVEDPEPYGGPVVGLRVGLQAVGVRAFVCGTDQPFAHAVIPDLLRARDAEVVAFSGEPLGALYKPHVVAEGGSLMALLAQVDTLWLPGPRPELRSLNRPSDLEEDERVQREEDGEQDRPAGEVALHQRTTRLPAGHADAEGARHARVLPRVQQDQQHEAGADEDLDDGEHGVHGRSV